MKKLFAIFVTTLLGAAAFSQNKNSIAVPAPKCVNFGGDTNWIPLFIQGVITSNFQQYSGLTVIDRQNEDMLKAEQMLSETGYFDEQNTIELGKMTSARLIVTGNIMAKSNAYALTFSITDAETGETKASASIPNCLRSALEDGTAANKISYDLMTSYGIALSSDAKKKLTQKADVMTSETSAQASMAKGIIAEKGGSNIEALTYYIQAKKSDKNFAEATSRISEMTTVVTDGNFGANAKNLIKLRNDWDKLLLEAAGLIATNPPEFEVRYFTGVAPLELTEEDYENGTMSFFVDAPYLVQTGGEENVKIAEELLTSMKKIEQSKNWGDKMNGFPWTYADDISGDNWLKWANAGRTENYPLSMELLDTQKKSITQVSYMLSVKYAKKYIGFAINNNVKNFPYLIISDVPVGNVDTDKIYISVESMGSKKLSVQPVSSDVIGVMSAITILKSGKHRGSMKICGFLGNFLKDIREILELSKKAVMLDLSGVTGLTKISGYSFQSCKALVSIVLPNGVTKIEQSAFEDCKSLVSITIPHGVTEIGNAAFRSCESLESVIIPASLAKIGMQAFYGCPFHDAYYEGSETQWKNISIGPNNNPLQFWTKIHYNYKSE